MSSDAIVVLKADHKEIRNLFRKFQAAGGKAVKKKETIVGQIITYNPKLNPQGGGIFIIS